MFLHQLQIRRNLITQQIENLSHRINRLPKNKLICTRNGSYVKWFQSNGSTHEYICKKDRVLAEKLALKKYCQTQILDLQDELSFIEKVLSHYKKSQINNVQHLLLNQSFEQLLRNNLNSHSSYIDNWLQTPYVTNSSHAKHLIHKTLSGELVRSKSEVIIANTLYSNKIPYIYERGIQLGVVTLFPDFTICHPVSHDIFYWEHCGMMDNQTYSEQAYNKLKLYAEHDILPSHNLILTFEDQYHPIDSSQIEQIVLNHFGYME